MANFYAEYMACLRSLGIEPSIHTTPDEFHDRIPYDQDRQHASYDQAAVEKFHRILIHCDRVFKKFRSGFLGKSSPVQFFWGSFDLALTRFSGRPAPSRPGAGKMMSESLSHEEISCGFWPGDPRYPEPAFYAYASPPPAGIEKEQLRPASAGWDSTLSEFLLKYEDVRTAPSPEDALLDFCRSSYQASAHLAGWDPALERPT